MSNFAHVKASLTASSLLIRVKLCWSIFRVMVLIIRLYPSPKKAQTKYTGKKKTETAFELQNHQKKRRKYENNQRPSRKLFSPYFIFCRRKGNDWPFAQTSRSTCVQGAFVQIWAVIMWKFVLIFIILTLSVNPDKTCVPLSSEIPTTTWKILGKFCMGLPDWRFLLDNIGSK